MYCLLQEEKAFIHLAFILFTYAKKLFNREEKVYFKYGTFILGSLPVFDYNNMLGIISRTKIDHRELFFKFGSLSEKRIKDAHQHVELVGASYGQRSAT